MKKAVLVFLVLVGSVGLAVAANQAYFMQAVQITSDQGSVYNRSWNPLFATVSPGGEANCKSSGTQIGFNTTTRECQLKWNGANAAGYKGYTDNILNDTTLEGIRYSCMDLELSPTTDGHVGYYAWATDNVTDVAGAWQPLQVDCTGTSDQWCLDSANNATATAAACALANTPLGTVNPVGGMCPIPHPRVDSANNTTGDMNLSWIPAAALPALTQEPEYRIHGLVKTTCTPPTSAEWATPSVTYPHQTGRTLTANVADFDCAGSPCTPSDQRCYYFATRLVYPSASGTEVASKYVSLNSSGVVFGGLATSVYDMKAVWYRNMINITWKSSLEEGTIGYDVMRAASISGPFVKVGEVAANGEPSSYSFLDTTISPKDRAQGVFYAIDARDPDASNRFGPVAAEKK